MKEATRTILGVLFGVLFICGAFYIEGFKEDFYGYEGTFNVVPIEMTIILFFFLGVGSCMVSILESIRLLVRWYKEESK